MMTELRNISYSNGNELTAAVSEKCQHYSNNKINQWHIQYNSSSCGLDNAKNKNTQKSKENEVPAVVVRNASMYYKKGVPVLQNLNMTVKRGDM